MRNRLFVSALALGLFAAFALETMEADARRRAGGGRRVAKPASGRRIGRRVARHTRGARRMRPRGLRRAFGKMRTGKRRRGGFAGLTGRGLRGRGRQGRGRRGLGGLRRGGRRTQKFGKKFGKFKKFGKRLMKKGGVGQFIRKFKKFRGRMNAGPFGTLGKLLRGRAGIARLLKGPGGFIKGLRKGGLNKFRGIASRLRQLGGKGMKKLGTFLRNFGGKVKAIRNKLRGKIAGAFGKLKALKNKLPKPLRDAIDQVQKEVIQESEAATDEMATGAAEDAAANELPPGEQEVAQEEPSDAPAAIDENGEPKNEPSAEPAPPPDANAAIDEAANEGNAEVPAPAPDATEAEAPAAE